MRESVRSLIEAPGFRLSDDQPQEVIDWVVALTDSWDAASTDQEAEKLVELLSRSDDGFFWSNLDYHSLYRKRTKLAELANLGKCER